MKTPLPLIFVLVLASGCRKAPEPAPAPARVEPAPTVYDKLKALIRSKGYSPEREKNQLQNVDALIAEGADDARDRAELVTPAPAGFKPAAPGRALKLTLSLEKSQLRRGETPRFRLEMTNTGSETIGYLEMGASFFKTGVPSTSRDLTFLVTRAGKETRLLPNLPTHGGLAKEIFPSPEGFQKLQARAKAESRLHVELAPGETLRTRGDYPGDAFRTLASDYLAASGAYTLRVKFDNRPAPPNEGYIQDALAMGKKMGIETTRAQIDADYQRLLKKSMGPTFSNAVVFEVAP